MSEQLFIGYAFMADLKTLAGNLQEKGSEVLDKVVSSVTGTLEAAVEDLTESGDRLQYPIHDTNNAEMFVTFQTLQQTSPDINKEVSKLEGEQKTVLQTLTETLPSRIENSQSISKLGFSKGKSSTARQPGVIGREVRLYMPAQIQFQDGMQYNTTSLGAIGGAAEGAIAQGASVAGLTAGAIGQGISDLIAGITMTIDDDVAAVAAQRAAAKSPIAGDKLAGAVSSATQTTVNPNNRTLFDGVNVRSFSFSFQLIAQSAEEAKVIEDIVNHFRTEMYPSEITITKGTVDIPIGYNFPKKWKIRFWDNKNYKEVFHKIKPAFLTAMNTTYNSGDATFHEDGKPTSVEITLTFTEERPLARKDIKAGY